MRNVLRRIDGIEAPSAARARSAPRRATATTDAIAKVKRDRAFSPMR
jgi:hypothetical protein